jgi:hypothetical protein
MRGDFADGIRELSRTFADLFDPYRPELHYMRGPGPKWRAKRAGDPGNIGPAAAETVSVLPARAEAA